METPTQQKAPVLTFVFYFKQGSYLYLDTWENTFPKQMGTEKLLNTVYETVHGKASQQKHPRKIYFPGSAYNAIS